MNDIIWRTFYAFLLSIFVLIPYSVQASMLGMSWGDSQFVSFDPYTGNVLGYHGGLDPNQNFVGLTRDSSQNTLFAAAQTTNNVYKVDANTGNYSYLGSIDVQGFDVTSLSFNQTADTLYATMVDKNYIGGGMYEWDSKLVSVSTDDASVLSEISLGKIFAGDLIFNPVDGLMYSQTGDSIDQYGGGSANQQISTIDPITGAVMNLFPSQETVLSGFGVVPDGDKLIGWANRNGHYFTEIDIQTGAFTLLANSDPSGVSSSGFIYEDFTLADVNFIASPPPPSSVPIPSAAWLFISGLTSLLVIRRKHVNT